MASFNEYARYYDLFYKDKDYKKESFDVIKMIENHASAKTNRMLVVGCGTGKHDREISVIRDIDIVGIDLSEEMIAVAERERKSFPLGERISYLVADARDFSLKSKVDCAVSLFHVMSYQRTNDDLKRCFQSINRSMYAGGIFVFDAWYGPGVLSDKPSVRVKTVEDDKYKFIRTAIPDLFPNENAVDVNYHICAIDKKTSVTCEIDEKHRMRYWFKPEVEELLLEEGFELLECLDCNSLAEANFDSWTTYFVCKKMKEM